MSEAIWALIGVIVGGALTGAVELFLQRRQFVHEIGMLKLQRQGAEVAKDILTEMLNHQTHIDRSFAALRRPIGGFSDDEVRQMLHDVDARRVEREDGSEWWYLRSRSEERNERRKANAG